MEADRRGIFFSRRRKNITLECSLKEKKKRGEEIFTKSSVYRSKCYGSTNT
jgi:hypothetical protein